MKNETDIAVAITIAAILIVCIIFVLLMITE